MAWPCDRDSLLGPVEAARRGALRPLLVGPRDVIERIAAEAGASLAACEIIEAATPQEAAVAAVRLCREGRAASLMKGSLHTDELMSAAVARDGGLRTGRRLSHVFAMDVPSYPKALFVTDAAINIVPDLRTKMDIVQNAADLLHALGNPMPKVAILSAVETVNPAMPSTLEAAALCKMADRGQITGAHPRRPARLRQRDQQGGGGDQEDRLAGRGRGRHPARARSRIRQHGRQATQLPGGRGLRRHRARRAGADHPDQPGGQRGVAPGLGRAGAGAGSSTAGARGMSTGVVGVINAGSSSLKISLYDGDTALLSGQVDGIGVRPGVTARDGAGAKLAVPDLAADPPGTPAEALLALLPWLREQLGGRPLLALGHRVVHGGQHHDRPRLVTPALIDELAALSPLAPLHQPHNLSPIRAAIERVPGVPQVACFDTAFHRTIPEVAQVFALPHEMAARGIRRYGFHGLSYEYIASVLPEAAPDLATGRVVVAHLGNGASLCALQAGRSVATTMGFSALDGLPMGTRCGEIDPAVVLHLMREDGLDIAGVEALLYKRSGLLGLSGLSSDFRDLLASEDPRARFAIEVFVYRVARGIGSMAAALGGLDGIVFTAGVGENAAPIRAAVCEACRWLGVELDAVANAAKAPIVSRAGSRVAVHVIPTDENLMIARQTLALVAVAGR